MRHATGLCFEHSPRSEIENLAKYRIWDGMRAVDYLASRPEVDAKRLGCVGNSGGGTLTAYIAALDPRVKAAYDYITKHYGLDENPGLGERGLYYYYQTFAIEDKEKGEG